MQQQIEKSFTRAVALHQRGDVAGAEALYLQVLKQQPRHAASAGNLAVLLRERGQPERAEQVLRTTLAASPKNVAAWTALSQLLLERGELDEAEAAVRAALAVDPRHHLGWLNLGAILAGKHQWQECLGASMVALSLKPNSPEAKQNAANAHFKLRNYDLAEKYYREALTTHPNPHMVHGDLAQLLKVRGRTFEAIDYFEKTLAIDGNDPDMLAHYGNALMILCELDKSAESLRHSLSLKPNDNWLAWHPLLFALN